MFNLGLALHVAQENLIDILKKIIELQLSRLCNFSPSVSRCTRSHNLLSSGTNASRVFLLALKITGFVGFRRDYNNLHFQIAIVM